MPTPFSTPTAATVRDNWLRTYSNYLISIGVPNPNVGYGSDAYNQAQSLANELEALYAAAPVAADQMMPDSATGADLVRQLAIFGDAMRPATASTGNMIFATSSPTFVAANSQLKDPSGNTVQVATSGVYANGASIPLVALSTGTSSNAAPLAVLAWVTPPAFAAPTSPLDAVGLVGGAAADTDATARARLLTYYATPPTSGNAAAMIVAASAGIAAAQAAFCYPAANGPGTVHVAVVGAQSASVTQSRVASAATVALATSGVVAATPEFVEVVVTGTVDANADVAIFLALPAATTAVPAGTGGGWLDGQPFPAPNTLTSPCTVSVVNATTVTIANCKFAPGVGNTVCAVINGALVVAHVTGVGTFAANTATNVVIDIPLSANGVALVTGAHVFPGAVNMSTYVATLMAAFASLGPGEKTAQTGLLPRGYRQPRWFVAWDYTIGPKFLKALVAAGSEVLDASWCYQNGGVTTPTIPGSIGNGPNIFVPRYVSFYQQ